MIARLLHDRRAAAAVEFAMVAPMLLLGLFTVIEGGRSLWTRQALQQTSFVVARCLALNTGCATAAAAQTYAVSHARRAGVRITTAQVTAVRGTTCNSQSGMTRVQINAPFNSAAGKFVPRKLRSIFVSACFPNPT